MAAVVDASEVIARRGGWDEGEEEEEEGGDDAGERTHVGRIFTVLHSVTERTTSGMRQDKERRMDRGMIIWDVKASYLVY